MLIAARSSQDLACCWRATAMGAVVMPLYFCSVRLRRHQLDFAGDAMDFGFGPSFVGRFHCGYRFANAGPSVGNWSRSA